MLAPQGLLGLFACSVSAPVRLGRPLTGLSLPPGPFWPKSFALPAPYRSDNSTMDMRPTIVPESYAIPSPCHVSATAGACDPQPSLCHPSGIVRGVSHISPTRLFLLTTLLFLLQALDLTSALSTRILAPWRSSGFLTPGCPLNLIPPGLFRPKSHVLHTPNCAANPNMTIRPTPASVTLSLCHACVTAGARSLQSSLCYPSGLVRGVSHIPSTQLSFLMTCNKKRKVIRKESCVEGM